MPTIWTKPRYALVCLVGLLTLQGCSSLEDQIPQDGPDMESIYNEYTIGTTDAQATSSTGVTEAMTVTDKLNTKERALIETSPALMSAYTRDASNELEGLFKTHPNPTLFMYTRPHLVGRDGIPVPGYTTQFKMFTRDHFALPGEVQ